MAKRRGFIIHPNYHFRHQDPAIGHVLSELKRSGISDEEVRAESNVSKSTLRSWRMKKTREPRHSTLVRTLRVLGKDYEIGKWDGRK